MEFCFWEPDCCYSVQELFSLIDWPINCLYYALLCAQIMRLRLTPACIFTNTNHINTAGLTALLDEREMDQEADNRFTLGETVMWGYPSGSALVT